MAKSCAKTCPLCSHSAKISRSQKIANGTRRRLISCKDPTCAHQWNEWDGPRGGRPRLSEAEIRLALTSHDLNHCAMARKLGCSHQAVRQLRLGFTCSAVAPELPRWQVRPKRTCKDCRIWSGSCNLGLPDPEEEGIGCAVDCLYFAPRAVAPISEASAELPRSASAG